MQHLAVCSFLEPQADGATFAASGIPLHVTVLGNFRFEGTTDVLVAGLIGVVDRLPIEARAGEAAMFGPNADVPVTLVTEAAALHQLHDAAHARLFALGATFDEPHYTGDGFRPHVTRVGGSGPEPGQTIRLDSLSLIDPRPDGNDKLRRVLSTIYRTR